MDTTNEYSTNLKINNYNKINDDNFKTPKRSLLNGLITSDILQQQQQQEKSSPINGDIKSTGHVHLLKERYLLLTNYHSNKTKLMKNLKCMDIYTEENYDLKLLNINYDKILCKYYQLNENNPDNQYNHQLICPIYDAVQISKNHTYILLKNNNNNNNYGDLHSYIKLNRRLTEKQTINLFKQICEIVKLCHNNGIIIRDLKLKKFYFIDSDRTQLQFESLDGSFILDNANDDTLNEKIGCPLYIAPEMITTNSTYAGYAADIWSLGIILYTMLIGRYPFSDMSGQILFNKILYGDVIMPNYISAKAKCLIKSLLMKNPNHRLIADDVLDHHWFSHNHFNETQFQCTDYHIVPDLDLVDELNNTINS